MKTKIVIFFLLLAGTFIIHAQPPHTFTHYSAQDGFYQKKASKIEQDEQGYVWFATWDGIYKFDGYTFRNYKARPGDFIGLSNNRIDNLEEDAYGYIWIVSYDQLVYRFNPRTEQFQSIPYPETYHTKSLQVTPSGYVWISTGEGLIQVRTHPQDKTITAENFSQKNSIPISETIYQIREDNQQTQWILTGNGIYSLSARDSLCVPYFTETSSRNHKQAFYAMEESSDQLFFTSSEGHVWCYKKKEGRFALLQLPTTSPILSVNSLSDTEFLFATAHDGFFVYSSASQSTVHYHTTTHRALPNNEIEYVYIDRYKEAWLRFKGNGVTHFDPLTGKITNFPAINKKGEPMDGQQTMLIHEDIHNNLWVHPAGGAFSYYDRKNRKLIPFFNEKLQTDWSSSDVVTATYSDRQGNLWLCTYANGLEKVTFNNSRFQLHTPLPNDPRAQANDVRAFFEDRNGRIWVGCKDKLIRIYDKELHFQGYLTLAGTISPTLAQKTGMAYSIVQDREGTLWIATKGDGIITLTPNKDSTSYTLRRYKHHPSDIYSLSDNNVHYLYIDSHERIWAGTYGGGLNYIERDADGRVMFISHRNHLKNFPIGQCHRIRCLTADDKGMLWVGTTKGLLSFDSRFASPEKIVFNHYTRIPGDIHSLSNNDVHNILSTRKKELYVATFGGGLNKLIRQEGNKAEFQSYTVRNGMPSDILYSLNEDTKGNLWIGMEEGICKFVPGLDTAENYNERYFPFPLVFSEGSSFRLQSGDIVVNSTRGYLVFHPDSVYKSRYIPSITFSQLQLKDKVILPGDASNLLTVDINDTPGLVLSHADNAFSIQYAALDLRYPEDILYAYRLEGFEDNWNYVGKNRIATYTNLPKGSYTLQVKSTNSEGVWMENTRTLNIEVLPSFWETPWAYLLYVLSIVLVILVAVYILFTIYRLKHEVSVEQQVSDIKLRFFTNISHELRTPLTLIAGPIEHILYHSPVSHEVKEQLLLVERNTQRMLRLVNQILDFRKIQNKKMKMRVQQVELLPFIQRVMESFQSIANEHQIDFTLETATDGLKLWVDADKLENVLFNLLSNAFKYTPQGKQIQIGVRETDNEVTISVADQGIGIDESQQKSLFVRFESLVDKNLFNQPSTGIGLSLVKELVEMHKGRISIFSQPGEGSCFSVELRKGKAHFDEDTEYILGSPIPDEPTSQQPEGVFTRFNPEPAPASPAPDEEANPETGKDTLLLVEDNSELRFFLKTLLSENFLIIEAANGRQGLEKALTHTPDIIISDVMMPEMDGISLTRELRRQVVTSHIPIVLLTAKSNIESKIEGLELGADDYITKPFSASYLKARVFNLLEQRKKLQSLYCASLTGTRQEREADNTLPTPPLSPNDRKFMDKLMELMEENLDNSELVVEELALKLGMSRSVFFKKLKSLVGLSPVEFIKEIRIKRSAELIESGGYNMAQVAYMVGFNDPHYFSKCFKQIYFMTPSEYKSSLELTKTD